MWQVIFRQDTKVVGTGTVLAVDADTELHYERRVDTAALDDVEAFVSEAKQKLAAYLKDKGDQNTVATDIANQLNA